MSFNQSAQQNLTHGTIDVMPASEPQRVTAPPRESWTASEWYKIKAANDVAKLPADNTSIEEPEIIRLVQPRKPVSK